jgi:hypothetical protein
MKIYIWGFDMYLNILLNPAVSVVFMPLFSQGKSLPPVSVGQAR